MGILSTTAGVVFASTLHTAGAIGMLGGLMAYVSWARGARRGDINRNLLNLGATLSYVSILANLLGGFMRTYQPGHPKFWELAEEPWALYMVIKHVVLFAGMFAMVYLFEVQAPRLRKAVGAGGIKAHEKAQGRREKGAVWTASGAIFVAALLGAIVGITPIAAMLGIEPEPTPVVRFAGQTYDFGGSVTGGPVAALQDVDRGAFSVPADVPFLDATLTTTQGATLSLSLTAPDGASVQATTTPTDGAPTAMLRVEAPAAGQWAYTVTGSTAFQAAYQLQVVIAPAAPVFLQETVTIRPGQFFEINTEALSGATLAWDWTASAHLKFDIHTHFDGDVQVVASAHEPEDAGSYIVRRDGGHSYLWENEERSNVRLTYTVWGDFEVDSYFPPR